MNASLTIQPARRISTRQALRAAPPPEGAGRFFCGRPPPGSSRQAAPGALFLPKSLPWPARPSFRGKLS